MITNSNNTTLYIGVTSNLIQGVYQHKNKQVKGFSAKYNLDKLVYFVQFDDMYHAITREKRLKLWKQLSNSTQFVSFCKVGNFTQLLADKVRMNKG